MHRIPAVLPASSVAADAAVFPCLDADGTRAWIGQPARRERRHARRPGAAWGAISGLAVAILFASATGAGAQVPRNGPEWNGKNHQPTKAETLRAERRAGVQPPKAEQSQDNRTVDQIDRQLLREEGLSTSSVPSAPR